MKHHAQDPHLEVLPQEVTKSSDSLLFVKQNSHADREEEQNGMTLKKEPMQVQPSAFTDMRLQSQAIVSLPFTPRR